LRASTLPLAGEAPIRYGRANSFRIQKARTVDLITNPALIAIAVFIAAIFILNLIEFGRVD
jgi:ribose/xylose/arabinose/galactoside ABC-type transport system permease subunit